MLGKSRLLAHKLQSHSRRLAGPCRAKPSNPHQDWSTKFQIWQNDSCNLGLTILVGRQRPTAYKQQLTTYLPPSSLFSQQDIFALVLRKFWWFDLINSVGVKWICALPAVQLQGYDLIFLWWGSKRSSLSQIQPCPAISWPWYFDLIKT